MIFFTFIWFLCVFLGAHWRSEDRYLAGLASLLASGGSKRLNSDYLVC